MKYNNPSLAPLPADTAQLAWAILPNEHRYLAIGDRLEPLLADINLSELYTTGNDMLAPIDPRLLLMIIIFQYMEGLSDSQVADQLPVRIDWKYALHLPLSDPGVGNDTLIDFRRRITSHRAGLNAFYTVLVRLVEWNMCNCWDGSLVQTNQFMEIDGL